MARTGKKGNPELSKALRRFSLLNFGNIDVRKDEEGNFAIICFSPPNKLKYPKGWHYKNGFFSKDGFSTDQEYNEAIMLLPNMHCWSEILS